MHILNTFIFLGHFTRQVFVALIFKSYPRECEWGNEETILVALRPCSHRTVVR